MDDDGERRGPSRGPRPERRDGPRGRGLGAPTETLFACSRCGARIDGPAEVAPDAVCANCGSDLHTCTNCRHFDTAAPRECRQPVPERVKAKAERNDCELFEPKRVKGFAEDGGTPSAGKAAFDALFDF